MTAAANPRAELARLLGSVAQGDRAAFERLYSRTSAKLFGVCLRILNDRAAAEEAVQEAYLSIWGHAGTFDPARASPMTWLITVARNRSIDRLRARRTLAAVPIEAADHVPDPAPDALAVATSNDESRRLAECMAELEAQDRAFLRTAFFDGSTYAELAIRAALPLGTVKSRVRRALLKLRACLQ